MAAPKKAANARRLPLGALHAEVSRPVGRSWAAEGED